MIDYAVHLVVLGRQRSDQEPASRDLAERVVSGDRAAFLLVYRAHFAEVRAFAERVLGSRAAAEDVVHDVFLELPRALAAFRGDGSLRSYVLSIAVRKARTHFRSAARRRKHEADAGETLQWTAPQPDVTAERRELANRLRAALDELPLDQRVAFVLCEVEERTSKEVGEILGENPSTIRARVFHAKKRLRDALGDRSGPEGAGEP